MPGRFEVLPRGLLNSENPTAVQYVVLAVISLVLAIGMSWSYTRRRMTGQTDVDDVGE